jgi:hypothetical protein
MRSGMEWVTKTSRAPSRTSDRQCVQRVADPVDLCLDEPGVVEVDADLVHGDLDTGLVDGPGDVLPVLPAARVGRVRRGDKRQQPSMPGGRGVAERVGEVRIPVAVAEVDGQVRPVGSEPLLQGRDQGTVLVVDRGAATVMVVVLRHLLQPLTRDVATTNHVLQEGQHLVGCLGAAEGDEQQGVVHVDGSGPDASSSVPGTCRFGSAVGRRVGSTTCAGVPVPRRGRRPCAG